MARPKKQTVEYFPHYVADGDTKQILQYEWGNDGYAFWFKMLEKLCSSDGHYLDLSSPRLWRTFLAYVGVNETTALEIMQALVEIGKIDTELWSRNRIVWCQSLVNNLKNVYEKRTISFPEKPIIKEDSENSFRSENGGFRSGNGGFRVGNPADDEFSGVSGVGNPQSKVKESKVDESTVEESKGECERKTKRSVNAPVRRFAPPSLDEVTTYCLDRNNRVDPQRFIDFYQSKGWMVGKKQDEGLESSCPELGATRQRPSTATRRLRQCIFRYLRGGDAE